MDRTNIYLERQQTEALDRLADAEGVSRAEIVRRLIDKALDVSGGSVEADLAAIESSFGSLRDVQAVTRGSGEREDHLARMWREP